MPCAENALELKYCERCGGLFLRPRGAFAIYCVPCAALMRQLPARVAPPSPASPAAVISAILLALCSLAPGLAPFLEVLG